MRVLIDANVLVSALLGRDRPGSAINDVVRGGLARRFVLVFPDDVAGELIRVTSGKPHLRRRIRPADAATLVSTLQRVGECPPPLVPPLPRVCRDPNDDYLVEHAVRNAVDVLVSSDLDLLVLEGTGLPFRVLNPREFLTLLDEGNAG